MNLNLIVSLDFNTKAESYGISLSDNDVILYHADGYTKDDAQMLLKNIDTTLTTINTSLSTEYKKESITVYIDLLSV